MLTSPFPSAESRRTAYGVFGSAASAPRRARAFVRCQLGRWELAHLAETAELVVSELVTNAVRATEAVVSPPVASSMFPVALRTVALRVRVPAGPCSLFIEVWDGSDGVPVADGGGECDRDGDLREGGRGLALVGSLARRWGHYTAPDRGKIVWCELAIAPADPVPRRVQEGPRRPVGALPRRTRGHPVAARADGPDETTLLRVLEGLRALDVSGPEGR